MKRKSRLILGRILLICGSFLGVLCAFFDWARLWALCGLLIVCFGFALSLCSALCPHCDQFGLKPKLWSKEVTCSKCHKTVRFE